MKGLMMMVPMAALLGLIVHPVAIVAAPSKSSNPSPELAETCDDNSQKSGDAGSSLLQTQSKKQNTLLQSDDANEDDAADDYTAFDGVENKGSRPGSVDKNKCGKKDEACNACKKKCRQDVDVKALKKDKCLGKEKNNNPIETLCLPTHKCQYLKEKLCHKTTGGGCEQWKELKIDEYEDIDYGSDRLACQKKCSEQKAAGCDSFAISGKKCYIYKAGCTDPKACLLGYTVNFQGNLCEDGNNALIGGRNKGTVAGCYAFCRDTATCTSFSHHTGGWCNRYSSCTPRSSCTSSSCPGYTTYTMCQASTSDAEDPFTDIGNGFCYGASATPALYAYHQPNYCHSGTKSGLTLQECKDICNKMPGCGGINWSDGRVPWTTFSGCCHLYLHKGVACPAGTFAPKTQYSTKAVDMKGDLPITQTEGDLNPAKGHTAVRCYVKEEQVPTSTEFYKLCDKPKADCKKAIQNNCLDECLAE